MKVLHTKKLKIYLFHILKLFVPKYYWIRQFSSELASINIVELFLINNRVDYYCKLIHSFSLNADAKVYAELSAWNGQSVQCLDLKQYIRYFPPRFKFHYLLGDVKAVPVAPTFLKSRPISSENSNSVILKLNAGRFYDFPKDRLSFNEKKPIAVFRGPCHKKHRQVFIEQTYRFPSTDIGDTRNSERLQPYYKGFMSQSDQLKYKYIISVEWTKCAMFRS